MELLIREAAFATIIPPDMTVIHCLAVPTQNRHYEAVTEEGKTFLLKNADVPCGSVTKNSSPAAAALVDKLNELELKFVKMIENN